MAFTGIKNDYSTSRAIKVKSLFIRMCISVSVMFAFCFSLQKCNEMETEKREFYHLMRSEYYVALNEMEMSGVQKAFDNFRKKIDMRLKVLKKPHLVWEDYRKAMVSLRFKEVIEKLCGDEVISEAGNMDLDSTALMAISFGYEAGDRCRRLILFSELYMAIELERIKRLPDNFEIPQKIQEKIAGLSTDPDCLVRAGYLFLINDEKSVTEKIRELLGSPESLECGTEFLYFLEPGNIDTVLTGIETILKQQEDAKFKGNIINKIVKNIRPILRQEGNTILKNLEFLYRSNFMKRKAILFLLSQIQYPLDGSFFEEVALYGEDPDDRKFALNTIAERYSEGLPHLKNILTAYEKPENKKYFTENFLNEIALIFIKDWSHFAKDTLEFNNFSRLLLDVLADFPALKWKMKHIGRISEWNGLPVTNEEAVIAIKEAVGAMRFELDSCWLAARKEDMKLEKAVINVKMQFSERGKIDSIEARSLTFGGNGVEQNLVEEENSCEILEKCVEETLKIISFQKGFFAEPPQMEETIFFPRSSEVKYDKYSMEISLHPELKSLVEIQTTSGNNEAVAPGRKIIPPRPSIGKIIVIGGKGEKKLKSGAIRKQLERVSGLFSLCAANFMGRESDFNLSSFILICEIGGDGKISGLRVDGEMKNSAFEKCIKRELKNADLQFTNESKIRVKAVIDFSR